MVGIGSSRRCRQGWRKGRSAFRSGRGCSRRVGLPDHEEWSGAKVNPAGYEVLQGRRTKQEVVVAEFDPGTNSVRHSAINSCAIERDSRYARLTIRETVNTLFVLPVA